MKRITRSLLSLCLAFVLCAALLPMNVAKATGEGDGDKEPITCRPADLLEPELPKIEAEMAEWKEQDEDVLTYALFPQVALDFFKYRKAQREKVDLNVADTENKAYPV